MILKVLQPDTGKWFYYDHIDLFKVKHDRWPKERPATENDIVLLSGDRRADGEEIVAICDVNFENGRCLTIVFSEEGYLLNDVGKTIEKIM